MLSIARLLRLPAHITILDTAFSASGVLVRLASQALEARCPRCQSLSRSRHSCYTRTAQDLAWSGQSVTLQITTHKWRCRVATCSQHVFAERLDPLLSRSARMTTRFIHLVRTLTLATSGRSASRLMAQLQLPLSSATLLRHIMALPEPVGAPARLIGVDEFSFRRGPRGHGHHFGTLIVDLERHRVLDLLPDRDVATVATWLRAHPSIQLVSRDRSGTFAQAITAALPHAQQVLDRFHLLQNVRDMLERFFLTKRDVLHLMQRVPAGPSQSASPGSPVADAQQERVARWVQLHRQIHEMAAKQVDVTTMARHFQVSRPTVYRYLRMPHPPTVRQPRAHRTVDPFIPYILQRWNDGVRNAQLIWRELQTQGYRHSVSNISRFMTLLRRESALPMKFRPVLPAQVYDVTTAHVSLPYSAVQVASLVVRQPECRTPSERAYLARLRATDAGIDQTSHLAEQFCAMVRLRQGERLDDWVSDVMAAPLPSLRAFVRSLLKEESALRAGLTLSMSQGQTEGQVHKLKLIKRQGYGRADFALLRHRVLHAW